MLSFHSSIAFSSDNLYAGENEKVERDADPTSFFLLTVLDLGKPDRPDLSPPAAKIHPRLKFQGNDDWPYSVA